MSAPSSWIIPVHPPSLGEAEVHVWLVPLALPAAEVEPLAALLTADELERAGRFRGERLRRRYTVGRGRLRELLGAYLGAKSLTVPFTYEERGKPRLPRESEGPLALRFNVSHSADLALIALARGHEVGVDIESIRPGFATDEIAQRFFAPEEVEQLRALAPAERAVAFYNCWTRKEAYIKARGEGLFQALASFAVTCTPGAPAALLRAAGEADLSRWTMWDLAVPDGFRGAVVVAGKEWQLHCWRASGPL